MTPSNDPNGKPLIYRIADALGVFHLVAPVNHTHSASEVEGLVSALAAKAAKVSGATNNNLAALDANGDLKDSGHGVTDSVSYGSSSLITSGGVHTALQGKADKNKISETAENGAYAMVEAETTDKGQLTIGLKDAGDSSTDYTSLTKANIGNLKRALLDPDRTPTLNSNKLVTSGGVKAALDNKSSIGNAYMDSKVEVEVKHIGDDEYDQATVIGGNRIFLGVGTDAEDGEAIIDANNIINLQRALLDPDTTPTANSNKLVTSGGVKAALGGKADTNHTHTPTDVQGVIPSFVEWSGQTLDLDTIIDGTLGMVRLMIYNNDSTDTYFGDLFESLEALPIHLNANAATVIASQHYALCNIYKMDRSQTPSEHDHDLCYFITLDGVFDDGNPEV